MKIKTPARICLFGDHQDYLGLPVIACAIDRYIYLEAKPNKESKFILQLPDIEQERYIDLEDEFEEVAPRDYFGSALRVLRKRGLRFDQGYDVLIRGNIPINSGLSSSTAVSLSWIQFLLEAFSTSDIRPNELAQLSYEAEVLEHGEPGGMMDQFSITNRGVIQLTTKQPYQVTPIAVDIPGLVIGNSGVEKKTIEILQQARDGGQEALRIAMENTEDREVASLAMQDVEELLPLLSNEQRPYLRAAIGNHSITQRAYSELTSSSPDWRRIGELMNQHQDYLRDDLKVSIPILDNMIQGALSAGALGAKLVGSGGGGCVVALAPGKEAEVMQAMIDAGAVEAFKVKVVQSKSS